MSQLLCHEYSFRQRTLPLSPTRSASQSACQAALGATQIQTKPVKAPKKSSKKWSWQVIKRCVCPSASPPLANVLGSLESPGRAPPVPAKFAQVHVFVIPCCCSCIKGHCGCPQHDLDGKKGKASEIDLRCQVASPGTPDGTLRKILSLSLD